MGIPVGYLATAFYNNNIDGLKFLSPNFVYSYRLTTTRDT